MNIEAMSCGELLRGCVEVLPEQGLEKKLASGKPLKIKAGFDPTAPDLHLGHAVLLHKLRQFQSYGHEVVFLIGDFTAMIGDPTGKNVARQPLSRDAVIENAKTYQQQAFKMLDAEKTTVLFNSQWLNTLGADGLIKLAATHTVARMLERDDFHQRFMAETPIAIHEFLYPLLQGYDSVELRADVELGGTDQKFNLLMGRELQRHFGHEPQVVMMTPLLEGLDGVKKMSKSLNNYIGIDEPADTMFGKIMSISDELLWRYFNLLSDKTSAQIVKLKQDVADGLNPRDVKVMFAKEIITRFHDSKAADSAHQAFIDRFQNKLVPDDLVIQEYECEEAITVAQLLKRVSLTQSTSESNRLIREGAVKIDGVKISDGNNIIEIGHTYLLQVGKRRLAKINLKKV